MASKVAGAVKNALKTNKSTGRAGGGGGKQAEKSNTGDEQRKKAKSKSDAKYIVSLDFQNDLPDIPFEPHFLAIPTEHGRLYKYKESTLEQQFQYEIHLQPKVVDTITIMTAKPGFLTQDELNGNTNLIDPKDRDLCRSEDLVTNLGFMRARPNATDDIDEKNKKAENIKFVEKAEKARAGKSWLLKTQYLENDIASKKHNYNSEFDAQEARRKKFEAELEESRQLRASKPRKDRIRESFQDVIAEFDSRPLKEILHPTKPDVYATNVSSVVPSRARGHFYQIIFPEDKEGVFDRDETALKDENDIVDVHLAHEKRIQKSYIVSDDVAVSLVAPSSTNDKLIFIRNYSYTIVEGEDRVAFILPEEPGEKSQVDFVNLEVGQLRLTRQDIKAQNPIERKRKFRTEYNVEVQENDELDYEDEESEI